MKFLRLRSMKNGPRWASGLLVGLIVMDSVHAVLPLIRERPIGTPQTAAPPAAALPRVNRRRGTAVNVQTIVAAHLFGLAARPSLDPADALPTTANLELFGTIAGDNPQRGFAIVAADGPQKVYKVGDAVGGASLHSVYATRVLLDRDGQLESLSLPRLSVLNGPRARSAPRVPVLRGSPEDADPHHVADILRSSPAVDNDSDKLLGFRITPVPPASRFMRAGLRPQDLVTAVNGTPLADEDPKHSEQVLDSALAANNATFTVIRNGHPLDVSVSVAD